MLLTAPLGWLEREQGISIPSIAADHRITERRAATRGAAATAQARPSPHIAFRTAALEDPGAAR
jgi:hypothetical protein